MILNLIIKPQSHIMIFYTKKKSCYVIKFKARIRVNNYDFLYLKHKKKKIITWLQKLHWKIFWQGINFDYFFP